MGHGALGGADNKADSIDHIHDALDLSSEILMAGGVHYVDIVVVVSDACCFGSLYIPTYKIVIPFSLYS